MTVILLVTAFLLTLNAAHSYILLTANFDDVVTIAKQVAASPVLDQLQNIWRRASRRFNELTNDKMRERANKEMDDESNDAKEESFDHQKYNADYNNNVDRRSEGGDSKLIDFGKNASVYLKSIKKIFDKL